MEVAVPRESETLTSLDRLDRRAAPDALQALTLLIVAGFVLGGPIIAWLPPLPVLDINPVRLLGIGIIALAAVTVARDPSRRSVNSVAVRVGVVAFMVLTMAYGFTQNPFTNVVYEVFPVLVFLGVWLLVEHDKYLASPFSWLRLFAVSGAVSGVVAICIATGIWDVPSWRFEMAARFLNPRTAWVVDSLAGVFGQFACVILVLESRRRADTLLFAVCFPLGWASILTGEFRAYILLGIALTFGYLFMRARGGNRGRALPLAVALLLLGIVFAIWNPAGRRDRILGRFLSATDHVGLTGTTDDHALNFRALERERDLEMASDHPFLGNGWGLAGSAWILSFDGESPMAGHNLYTSSLARLGFIGGALLITAWLAVGWRSWNLRRQHRFGPLAAWSDAAFLVVVGFLIVANVQDISKMSLVFPWCAVFWALPVGEAPLNASLSEASPFRSRQQPPLS